MQCQRCNARLKRCKDCGGIYCRQCDTNTNKCPICGAVSRSTDARHVGVAEVRRIVVSEPVAVVTSAAVPAPRCGVMASGHGGAA